MDLLQKAKRAGIMLGGAAAITIGLSAAAQAECYVKVKDHNDKQVSMNSRGITSRDASGPKDSWLNVCIPFAKEKFVQTLARAIKAGESLKNLREWHAEVNMVCYGNWVGKWCTNIELNNKDFITGLYQHYTNAATNTPKKSHNNVTVTTTPSTKVEVDTRNSKIIYQDKFFKYSECGCR